MRAPARGSAKSACHWSGLRASRGTPSGVTRVSGLKPLSGPSEHAVGLFADRPGLAVLIQRVHATSRPRVRDRDRENQSATPAVTCLR
jgi:hypothetical protein